MTEVQYLEYPLLLPFKVGSNNHTLLRGTGVAEPYILETNTVTWKVETRNTLPPIAPWFFPWKMGVSPIESLPFKYN